MSDTTDQEVIGVMDLDVTSGRDPVQLARARAEQQLRHGEFIGERKALVRSVHPMRPEWEKFGKWWTVLGRDGDVKFKQGVGPIVPMVLHLFYVKLDDGTVEQLAWERQDLRDRWQNEGHEPPLHILAQEMTVTFHDS